MPPTCDLTPELHGPAADIAPLPDMVRGYKQIKLGNVAVYRSRLAEPASPRLP